MANVLTTNPLKIDTASATALFAAQDNNRLYIQSIQWDSEGAAAGDNAVVQDGNGNPIWQKTAAASKHSSFDLLEQETVPYNGLKVPTLDSGTLLITLR